MSTESRPAFYAVRRGRLGDYVTLLHPPYTLWHLSYVVVGACLAPHVDATRLGLVLASFGLALGVGAHALDELRGRPLRTSIASPILVALAASSIAGAAGIGIYGAVAWSLWLLVFVAAGVILVLAYNLELFGGMLHSDLWFSIGWGGFPVLTGYFAEAERLRWEALLAALFAAALSHAQRALSTAARALRRRTRTVSGTIERLDGTREELTAETLLAAPEAALRAMSAAIVALAAALLVFRFA